MDSELDSDVPGWRWQYSLRTLLIVFAVSALAMSLLRVGGGAVLASTLLIGMVIGGAISLLGSNKRGATPLVVTCASVAGALSAEILGVYAVDFNVDDVGRIPVGYALRDLFWFAFWGALLGALSGAAGRWLASRSTGAAGEGGTRD